MEGGGRRLTNREVLLTRLTGFLALAALASMSMSCSESNPSGAGGGGGGAQISLVFTRADQSVVAFSSAAVLFVWCGPWEEGTIPTESLKIIFGGPGAGDPIFRARVVVADVAIGVPLAFPNNFVFDEPKDADLFLFDPSNELSTQDDESSGSITFQKLDCGSGGEVQFSIDAVIGSEFGGGPTVSVTGSFQGEVGPSPN